MLAGGRLLADRAAGAGPFFGRRPALRGVRPGRGHPRPGRQPGERRPPRTGDPGNASGGEGGQFRRDLRAKPLRAGPRRWESTRTQRPSSSTTISRGIRESKNSSARYWQNVAKTGMLRLSWDGDVRSAACGEGAGRQRNLAERTAVNTVIQGSAADLIKLAMVAIHRRLRKECLSARMLLQIHDELIFEVPTDQLHHLAELVTEEMVGVYTLNVPLKVDIKAGPNWAATEEVGESGEGIGDRGAENAQSKFDSACRAPTGPNAVTLLPLASPHSTVHANHRHPRRRGERKEPGGPSSSPVWAPECWTRIERDMRRCGCRRSKRRRGDAGERRFSDRTGESIGHGWPASCSRRNPRPSENGTTWNS